MGTINQTVMDRVIANLNFATEGLSDVLNVPLIIRDSRGKTLTEGQWPSTPDQPENQPSFEVTQLPKKLNITAMVIHTTQGKRRIIVPFIGLEGETWFVETGDISDYYTWIDGKLKPQKGIEWSSKISNNLTNITKNPLSLIDVYVATTCCVAVEIAVKSPTIIMNNLHVENIRRIGLCLRKKIETLPEPLEQKRFSLTGIPSLANFFLSQTTGNEEEKIHSMLSETMRRLTVGAKGSFNLMDLSGDFVIKMSQFSPLCNELRCQAGDKCFVSDIKCLIEATLHGSVIEGIPDVKSCHCYVGLTEIVAPICVDGLVVGLVFGGQLIDNKKRLKQVMLNIERLKNEYLSAARKKKLLDTDKMDALSLVASSLKTTSPTSLKRTKAIVSGIAVLIGLLFERYCDSKNEALLLEELVSLSTDNTREILQKACEVAQRLLGVTHCSAFLINNQHVVLEATTAPKLFSRKSAQDGSEEIIDAKKAIGYCHYNLGDGLTGTVAMTGEPMFVPHPNKDPLGKWKGKWNEIVPAEQCLLAPIIYEDSRQIYGVLRGVRPRQYTQMPIAKQRLFAVFAQQLGVFFRNIELAKAESETFKTTAIHLQDLLAKVVHEFQAPLHNVLQLTGALKLLQNPTSLDNTHQKIKEEVYRAKKVMDSYLSLSVKGQEEVSYNFKPSSIEKMIEVCASRFLITAARVGKRIDIDHSSFLQIPEIVLDSERIEQVFTNIIDNAVKYSFEKSRITIKAQEKKNTVNVHISDFGLGIPPEARKLIFEGYQRPIKDKGRFKPGSGLGLTIAKEIVERHGGTIDVVDSEPKFSDKHRIAKQEGFQTTFMVSLPKTGPKNESEGG